MSSKKTETLEVRITLETKLALKEKAARENRNLSDAVRQLIDGYLEPEGEVVPLAQPKGATMIFRRPRAIAALLAALGSLSLLMMVPSRAQDVELQLRAGITKSEMSAAGPVRKSAVTETTLILSPGKDVTITTGEEVGSAYTLTLNLDAVGDERFRLTVRIMEGDELIAVPTMEADYGSDAEIRIGNELDDGTPFDMVTVKVVGTQVDAD
jgi:hypothetical protein